MIVRARLNKILYSVSLSYAMSFAPLLKENFFLGWVLSYRILLSKIGILAGKSFLDVNFTLQTNRAQGNTQSAKCPYIPFCKTVIAVRSVTVSAIVTKRKTFATCM